MTLAPARRGTSAARAAHSTARPVLLATTGVPLDERAAAFAVDSAVESALPLLIVNVTTLEPLALSVILGYDALPELTPSVTASLRSSAELARSLGVPVERLRIRSPRPVRALLELVSERRPGLLVFGPDRLALSPRRYRRALEALVEGADCLVWASLDPPPSAP